MTVDGFMNKIEDLKSSIYLLWFGRSVSVTCVKKETEYSYKIYTSENLIYHYPKDYGTCFIFVDKQLDAIAKGHLAIDRELNDIYNYLKNERQVDYLVHFTNIKNLSSILKRGILPRNDDSIKNIIIYSDENRLDYMPECSCFTISFPNYKMFSRKWIYDNPTNEIYVVLEVSIDVLLSDGVIKAYFTPTNAAASEMVDIEERTHLTDVKRMFGNIVGKDGKDIVRDPSLPSQYTTDPQAEVLLEGIVNPKYIKRVNYRQPENKELFNLNYVVLDRIEQRIDYTFFAPRADYENWK